MITLEYGAIKSPPSKLPVFGDANAVLPIALTPPVIGWLLDLLLYVINSNKGNKANAA